jgi:hypothetical protein
MSGLLAVYADEEESEPVWAVHIVRFGFARAERS